MKKYVSDFTTVSQDSTVIHSQTRSRASTYQATLERFLLGRQQHILGIKSNQPTKHMRQKTRQIDLSFIIYTDRPDRSMENGTGRHNHSLRASVICVSNTFCLDKILTNGNFQKKCVRSDLSTLSFQICPDSTSYSPLLTVLWKRKESSIKSLYNFQSRISQLIQYTLCPTPFPLVKEMGNWR